MPKPVQVKKSGPVPIYERKDFRWLVGGGTILTLHAGYINVCLLLGSMKTPVSHVTGTVSNIGIRVVLKNPEALFSTMILVSFMFGSFLTGIAVGTTKFKMQPVYGVVMMAESVILLVSSILFTTLDSTNPNYKWIYLMPAVACGIQNAMCTTFSGAVIRTTHMTGMSTDIAMICGQYVRHLFGFGLRKIKHDVELWKLIVFIPLWLGFLIGGFLGALAFQSISYYSLIIPSLTLGLCGLMFFTAITFSWITIYQYKDQINKKTKEFDSKIQLEVKARSLAPQSKHLEEALAHLNRTFNKEGPLVLPDYASSSHATPPMSHKKSNASKEELDVKKLNDTPPTNEVAVVRLEDEEPVGHELQKSLSMSSVVEYDDEQPPSPREDLQHALHVMQQNALSIKNAASPRRRHSQELEEGNVDEEVGDLA